MSVPVYFYYDLNKKTRSLLTFVGSCPKKMIAFVSDFFESHKQHMDKKLITFAAPLRENQKRQLFQAMQKQCVLLHVAVQ